MYSGNLIDQLMATVERAEARAHQPIESDPLERWYARAGQETSQIEHDLLGVA